MSEKTSSSPSQTPPWEAKSKEGNQNKTRTGWGILIGLALLGLVAYGFREAPIDVETASVDQGLVRVEVVEEGKTRIKNRYVVSSPYTGEMQRIDLKPGDPVVKGETVITQIRSNPAVLLDARSKAQADARVAMAQAAWKRSQEQLEIAKTSERFAQSNLKRLKRIKETGSVSESDYEMAERDALVSVREIVAAQAALEMSQHELEQAKAAALEFESHVADSITREVKSPVSGVVLQVQQESAKSVNVGLPLIEVGDPRDLEIEAEILSKDAVAMKAGDSVLIEQWGGETPLQGRVRLIEPAAFTKVSALGVEEQRVWVIMDLVSPPETWKALKDRYRVEVRVATWEAESTLRLPSGAVFREGTQWKTFVLEGGKARMKKVQLGPNDGKFVQVLGGVQLDEEVLVHPPDSLKDGARVAVREP